MTEREVNVRILPSLREELAGRPFDVWFNDQLVLAMAMDEGRIFQKAGNDFLKIRITDIRPYDESWGNVKNGDACEAVSVSVEDYDVVKDKPGDVRDWVLRVINLGLMQKNMNLYYLNDSGEYSRVFFTES